MMTARKTCLLKGATGGMLVTMRRGTSRMAETYRTTADMRIVVMIAAGIRVIARVA